MILGVFGFIIKLKGIFRLIFFLVFKYKGKVKSREENEYLVWVEEG